MSCEHCAEKITYYKLEYDNKMGKFLLTTTEGLDFKGNYTQYGYKTVYFKNKNFKDEAKKIVKNSVKIELLDNLRMYNEHLKMRKKNIQETKRDIIKLEKIK